MGIMWLQLIGISTKFLGNFVIIIERSQRHSQPLLPPRAPHFHNVVIAYTPRSEPWLSIVKGGIPATAISTTGPRKFNYILLKTN